jgi:hypothetical protein
MGLLVADRVEIAKLINFAKNNVITINENNHKALDPVGDKPEYCRIFGNYRVVFSFENQPTGMYRHLSVSCFPFNGRKFPSQILVHEIMKEFEFKICDVKHEDIYVWLEKGLGAVNVVEAA